MTSQKFIGWLVVALVLSVPSNSLKAAEMPDHIQIDSTQLLLNGSGSRTKYLMQMYLGGLYLRQPSSEAEEILTADEPMAIRLQITSSFVSQEKLVASLNEGFQNSTGGRVAALESQIEQFRQCFADPIAKGDIFEILYLPGQGVYVVKNGQRKGIIPGLVFKYAVFGIWLGDKPADTSLRVAMLQGRK